MRKNNFNVNTKDTARKIVELVLKLDTKSLLTFNQAISEELKNRSDLDDYINKK